MTTLFTTFKTGDHIAINAPGTEAHGLCGVVVDVIIPGKISPIHMYGIETGLGHNVYYRADEMEQEE